MKNLIAQKLSRLPRQLYGIVASIMVVASLPFIFPGLVNAVPVQMQNRLIQLSDAAVSGSSITSGIGSGTNVTYLVSFDITNAASSMVIDFCTQNPILSDTCTAPSGMTAPTAVAPISGSLSPPGPSGTGPFGPVNPTDWTLTTPVANRVKLADTSGTHPMSAASTQAFELTGITNPDTVGTFYARMYTYSDNSFGSTTTAYVSPTSLGDYNNYGGSALSTINNIKITARVQEKLTFCVTRDDPLGVDIINGTAITSGLWGVCNDTDVTTYPPDLTLGQGTPTATLDPSRIDPGAIYSQLDTNATHGAVIKLRNSNGTCGGLSVDGGTTCAIGPFNNSGTFPAAAWTINNAGFGLFVYNGVNNTNVSNPGPSGTITADATYNDGNGSHTDVQNYFNMDNTTANDNVHSAYGSTLAATTGPTYGITNKYVFAASSSVTTPAGLYTANLAMIVTGTF